MILFKPYHVPLILSGRKTQTRRLGKKRWIVGAVHQAKVSYMAKPFASIKVKMLWKEKLGQINHVGAIAEGYDDVNAYLEAFEKIYGAADMQQEVWVLDFERVEAHTASGDTREEIEGIGRRR